MSSLSGMDVFVNYNPPPDKQFRFPRTRKKRVMKKWRKNPTNFRKGEDVVFRVGNKLIMSPAMYQQLVLAVSDLAISGNLFFKG